MADVGQVPTERPDLGSEPMDLDPGAVQLPLAQLAHQQGDEEALLQLRGSSEEAPDFLPAYRLGAPPGCGRDPPERRFDREDLQPRRHWRRRRQVAERSP